MGRELEEQAEMLEDTENITDRVGSKLGVGMKKIRYVIEKNEGKSRTGMSWGIFWGCFADYLDRQVLQLLHFSLDRRSDHLADLAIDGLSMPRAVV
jgi:hypothetical protein